MSLGIVLEECPLRGKCWDVPVNNTDTVPEWHSRNLVTLSIILIFNISIFLYNLTHRRMFASKVWTDDSKPLQESNLAARQPRRAPHLVIQAT